MIHYHGTPITPNRCLFDLAGRSFCVSWFSPYQIKMVHDVGDSVMLDNGAFSHWRKGCAAPDWAGYYQWVEPWLRYHTTWAVIPDVIDGGEAENDALVKAWPHGHKGAPVWHLHESLDRLLTLVEAWPRVCIGSSGAYRAVGSALWHQRMAQAFNAMCPAGGPTRAAIHMLRGMQCSRWHYPFASVDSTDVAVNHCHTGKHIEQARYWGAQQPPSVWTPQPEQLNLLEAV